MDEADNSNETDTFTGSVRSNPKPKSQSFLNLAKKNQFMKTVLIILGLLIVVLIAVIIFIAVTFSKGRKGDQKVLDADVCHTEDCIKTAKYLYENMDLTVDPCEDFYNFTCRGWGIHNPRPLTAIMWGVANLVSNNLNAKIRAIVENADNEKVSVAVQKAQSFYMACTDTGFWESKDEYGREQLEKVLKKTGGVPMLSSHWNSNDFDWENVYVYCDLNLNSMQTFFEYKIDRTDPNDLKNVIMVKMPEAYFIAPKLMGNGLNETLLAAEEKKFKDGVIKDMKDLNSDLGVLQLNKDLTDFIEFEKKLYELSSQSSVNDTEEEYKRTLATLAENSDGANYVKIFNSIFAFVNITIPENEEIWLQSPTYFQKLGKLISETSKRTIANYMGYSIILGFGRKVIPNFKSDEKIDENKLKTDCTQITEKFFRVALNYWFVKKYFGREMMQQISDFLREIKNSLTLTIQTNKWMDDSTKLEAQRKLNSMIDFIATAIDIKNDNDLDNFYKKTGFISAENFPYDYKKMSKWFKYDQLTKLREIGNKKQQRPSTVNAFYSPSENKIRILNGILTPPFFYPNAPISVNMAAIGSVIGHEITHGFDNTGSQFDYKGYQKNWWDEKTLAKYKDKVNCFIDQYSEFVEPKSGVKVNGNLTVGENIADNGAMHQAFAAYKMYASLQNPEKDMKLPLAMSKFTKDQLFFIAYANTHCNDHRKDLIFYLSTDPHSPDVTRVIVPLQNSQEFSKALNCKLGSKMNPENKCILW